MQLTDREQIPFAAQQKFSIGILSELSSAREDCFSNIVGADNDDSQKLPPKLMKKKHVASSRIGSDMN